jgi:hypothetical protein
LLQDINFTIAPESTDAMVTVFFFVVIIITIICFLFSCH